MSDIKACAGETGEHITDYFETFFKLLGVKIIKKGVHFSASVLFAITICFLGVFVLFFASFAAGAWLGNLVNNRIAGYLIISSFFLLLIIIIALFRKRLIFPFIRNVMVKLIYD